jgi:hypothetical protein
MRAMASSASGMRGRDMCAGGIQALALALLVGGTLRCSSCCRGIERARVLRRKFSPRFHLDLHLQSKSNRSSK